MWWCVTVTTLIVLAFAAPGRAQEKAYEKMSRLVQLAPEDDFEPTVATLVGGELSCPSGRALVILLCCASEMMSAPDATKVVLAECKREATKLDCAKTKTSQLVNVLKVYDMTVPGHAPDKRLIARIRLRGGDDRYVGVASLDF